MLTGYMRVSTAEQSHGLHRSALEAKVAMALMADRNNAARDVADEFRVSLSTLSSYVDGQRQSQDRARQLLAASASRRLTSLAAPRVPA